MKTFRLPYTNTDRNGVPTLPGDQVEAESWDAVIAGDFVKVVAKPKKTVSKPPTKSSAKKDK